MLTINLCGCGKNPKKELDLSQNPPFVIPFEKAPFCVGFVKFSNQNLGRYYSMQDL